MPDRFPLLFLAVALLSASTRGQTSNVWENLGKTPVIAAGAEMEARNADHKRYRGEFVAVEGDTLVINTSGGEQRLPRASISRVSVKKPGHRLRNTLIGLGIGAAGGLTLGAVADARCTGNCIEGKTPLGKLVGTPLGALIGTIIGVALPTGGWRVVYRANPSIPLHR